MKLSTKYKIIVWLIRAFLLLTAVGFMVTAWLQYGAGGNPMVIVVLLLFTALLVVSMGFLSYIYNEDYKDMVEMEKAKKEFIKTIDKTMFSAMEMRNDDIRESMFDKEPNRDREVN